MSSSSIGCASAPALSTFLEKYVSMPPPPGIGFFFTGGLVVASPEMVSPSGALRLSPACASVPGAAAVAVAKKAVNTGGATSVAAAQDEDEEDDDDDDDDEVEESDARPSADADASPSTTRALLLVRPCSDLLVSPGCPAELTLPSPLFSFGLLPLTKGE